MTGSPPAALARDRHLSPRHGRHRPWLAALTAAVGLVSACGGSGATSAGVHSSTARPGGSPSATAQPAATGPAVAASYCATADTPIPHASDLLQGVQVPGLVLTPVQQAWLAMGATMVPACSEITPDAPPVQTRNLTDGELSDADLATWVQEDQKFWALVEWAQRHDQPGFIQYLYGGSGNQLLSFVLAGGTVVDSPGCEYPSKVDAVAVTGQQMSELTAGTASTAGVVYLEAAEGPCTSLWTAADGTVQHHDLAQGQEGRELDVSAERSNAALGSYLVFEDGIDQGDNPTADAILQQSGI